MLFLNNFYLSLCFQTSNTDRWNSFLNYGLKNPVNDSYLVHVFFKNEADYPVNIYKTNYNKNTLNPNGVIETTLGIGDRIRIPCSIGDTFTAKVNVPGSPYDNLLLLAYDVSRVYVNDYSCDNIDLKLCDRKPFNGDMRWTPPDSLMFSSLTNYNSSLYFWDGSCEEYIENLNEHHDFHIMSTIGHSFRLRNAETKKFLFEYKFEEVVIKGLENDYDYEISEKATELFDVIMIENIKNNVEIQKKIITELESRSSKVCF